MTASRTTRSRNRGRRAEVETDLREKYNVDFQYRSGVSIDEFDIDKSLDNQARFEALDEPTVETYKEAIERGDEFPAVIAFRPGRAQNQKLVIIDGNHRLVAHDRAQAPIDVYEVARGTRPATIVQMTYTFNTKHGRPTSEAERVHQALFLINNGATIDTAAGAVNLPANIVKREQAKAKANQRADDVGVDRREWDSLTASVRSRLLAITTDEGFHGAAHLAYIAKLSADEVFDLVALLNGSRSAVKQRKIITEQTSVYQDRIQSGGSGTLVSRDKRALSPKARVHMVLGQLHGLPDDLNQVAALFAGEERSDVAVALNNAAERLHKLARNLDPSLK